VDHFSVQFNSPSSKRVLTRAARRLRTASYKLNTAM
jgi:hypothetical protein